MYVQVELLRGMVGAQHSVEKEKVYPIFSRSCYESFAKT